MNIAPYLPYWHKGRYYPNRFELNIAHRLDTWQHPDQTGSRQRPNGHAIQAALEASLFHRVIGLRTLLHYQAFPEQKPKQFENIHMCGWLDVVHGPYAGRLFVPTLTSQNAIHWMDLNSGFNSLDVTPLNQRT